jgi:DNA-binding NarL/FixJ family response regulator
VIAPTPTIVIGCRDAARGAALTRAITARTGVTVTVAWPLPQAIAAGREADTAAVVLDGFPSGTTLRAMADVTRSRPELIVLVLGPLEPNLEVLVALASGAAGYLPTGSTPSVVAEAVEAVLAGDMVLPRPASLQLVQHLRSGGRGVEVTGPDARAVDLTNREWEVLVLLRQAHSTAEIARRLGVSNGTVRSHVAALVRKLGARDRRELTGPVGTDEG